MALSDMAQVFLAQLDRDPPVPIARVREGLAKAELPELDVWLEFHDAYAGYIEMIGKQGACWGVMHDRIRFSPVATPGIVHYYGDPGDDDCEVFCADTHPSYNYSLDRRGHLQTGPVDSFDRYVEQCGLWHHFCTTGATPNSNSRLSQEDILALVYNGGAGPVEEVSDQYQQYWRGDNILAIWDIETSVWVNVVTR
jgi:hypothetical protein